VSEYPEYASGWSAAPGSESVPTSATVGAPSNSTDLRIAAWVVAALAGIGAVLGVLWSAWSGPQQRAYVVEPGRLYPFDEVETMAAADGRYLILVGLAGLLAGAGIWYWRAANRGPLVALALGLGGLAGAALTWLVGYLTGGGTYDGRKGTIIAHLPLSLRMHGLLFAEPVAAVLVYGLFAAFAVRDDLGRDDPVRERALASVRARSVQAQSVEAGEHPQYGGGYGDAAGAAQQGDLSAQ
jgi:hypothetical protein